MTGNVIELSNEPVEEKEAIKLMDKQDTDMMRSDADVAEEAGLVYSYWQNVKGGNPKKKYRIGYLGVKQLVQEQCDKGNPISIEDDPRVELVKYDDADRKQWVWQANASARSLATKVRTIGLAEHPYLDQNGQYDSFARTTAVSKAVRNAYRLQVPEPQIQGFLNSVSESHSRGGKGASKTSAKSMPQPKPKPTKKATASTTPATAATKAAATATASSTSSTADSAVAPYLAALEAVGYNGPVPETPEDAAKIINQMARESAGKPAPHPPAQPEQNQPAEKKDWHDDPITDKQKYKLQQMGVDDSEIPDTKGDAHKLIEAMMEAEGNA